MVLPQLKKKGRVERAKLGVYIQRMTASLARSFGLKSPYGALVSKVLRGSPAARAGLRSGDIILRFNGIKIQKDSQLPLLVAFNPPGSKAKLLVLRNRKKIKLTVVLQRWGQDFRDMTASNQRIRHRRNIPSKKLNNSKALTRLGVGVSSISPSLRKRWKLPKKGGLRISSLVEKSPAVENGLRRGDVIMEVNRQLIRTPQDLIKAISKIPSGDNILLLIRRGDSSLFLAFTLQ